MLYSCCSLLPGFVLVDPCAWNKKFCCSLLSVFWPWVPSLIWVSGMTTLSNCPTKRLSTFIDTIIKPLVLHIKSYIRDSIHFLQKCSRIANDRTVLCTFDVKSLYTNIPHEYGLEAMSYWLNRHQDSLNPRFSKAFILESIEFILKNNNFMFNDEYFLQLVGTVTGTDMAPTYATLTMGYHEVKFYSICELNWGAAVRQYIEETWGHFLDDCEIPLDQDKVKPEAIKDVLNSIHPKIQFTMEHSEEMVPFLDVLIRKEGNKIWMDLYTKPTNTRRYLPYKSAHPKHCKVNIPFCLARRICIIMENEQAKLKHLEELKEIMCRQKYPLEIINKGITKAISIPQTELRQPKDTENSEKVLPFVTTYNQNNPSVFSTIKTDFQALCDNEVPGMRDFKLIQSRRQPSNLKKILTKAEFTSKPPIVSQCGNTRCECCKSLLLSDHYVFKEVNYKFTLKMPMSCESSNLIYVLVCSGCYGEYIGETGINQQKLRDRVRVYRQHIRQPEYQQLKVEEHLRNCSNGEFKIFSFLQMRSTDKDLRRQYEVRFQQKFQTKLNKL